MPSGESEQKLVRRYVEPYLVSLTLAAVGLLMTLDWRKLVFNIGSYDYRLVASPPKFVDKSLALFLLGLIALGLMRQSGTRRWNTALEHRLFLAYTGLAGVSVLWSHDVSQSLQKWVGLMVCLAAAWMMVSRFRASEFQMVCWLAPTLFVSAILLIELAWGSFTPLTKGYRFHGIVHPNQIGMLLVVALLSRLFEDERLNAVSASFFGLGLLLLMSTRSRASIAAFFLTLLLLGALELFRRDKQKAVKLGAVLAVSVGGLLYILFDWEKLEKLIQMGRENTGSVATLNGRLPLWGDALRSIRERPLFGHGYAGYWSPQRVEEYASSHGWAIDGAHNSALEVALGLGLTGLGIFTALFLLACWSGWKRWNDGEKGALFLLALLLSGFFLGILENNYARPGSLNALLTYSAALALLSKSTREEVHQESFQRDDFRQGLTCILGLLFFCLQSQWEYLGGPEELSPTLMASVLTEPSQLRLASFLLMALLATKFTIHKYPQILERLKAAPFFTAYLVLCAISVTWSPHPIHSGKRLLGLFAFSLLAVGLSVYFEEEELQLVLRDGCGILVSGAVVVELLYCWNHNGVLPARLGGPYHPNTLGALAGIWILALSSDKRAGPRIWLPFAFVCLIGSGSRTALLATAVGLSVQAILSYGSRALLALTLALPVVVQGALHLRETSGAPLNGRIELWKVLLLEVKENPWVGNGYESFWTIDNIVELSEKLYWSIPSAHSAILEVLLSTGILGLLTIMSFVIYRLRPGFLPRRGRLLPMLLGAALTISTVESTFVKPYTLYGLLLLALLLSNTKDRQES